MWQKSSGGGGGGGEMPMFADMMMNEDEPLPNAEERGGGSGSDTYRLKRFPSMALDASAEDGETTFELDLSDASPAVDYGWGGWAGGGAPALLVEATARDASTGETQTGTASPRYRATGPSLFKPGIDAACGPSRFRRRARGRRLRRHDDVLQERRRLSAIGAIELTERTRA